MLIYFRKGFECLCKSKQVDYDLSKKCSGVKGKMFPFPQCMVEIRVRMAGKCLETNNTARVDKFRHETDARAASLGNPRNPARRQ